MIKVTRKFWLGVGAAMIASSPHPPASAQHGQHQARPKSPAAAESDAAAPARPQSGEAYLTDGGPKDSRIRIYRDIALIRGHLLVGEELVELGRWDDALPHFLHPTEELYGAMERHIKLHKVTPFDRQLKQLAQAVKARNKAAYAQAAKVVDERLANALTSFRRFMQGAPFTSFTMRAAVEVLKVAAAEYEAAVEDDRIAKPVEYQDGRGFVLYAEKMIEAHRGDLEKVDKLALDDLLRMIGGLKMAWPGALPPERPAMPAREVAARIEALEKRAERFF